MTHARPATSSPTSVAMAGMATTTAVTSNRIRKVLKPRASVVRTERLSANIGHPEMLCGTGVPRPPGRRDICLRDRHRLALPVAGRAQAGPLPDQRREPGIASEMAVDGGDVGAEIEHAADPRYDGRQRLYRGEAA